MLETEDAWVAVGLTDSLGGSYQPRPKTSLSKDGQRIRATTHKLSPRGLV